ncbi:hypothetical protein CK203_039982 [Vitis vinifera]|uniref:C2H2-type domain-containing protein n=1 Tax=Vitis vinifera TaxID=29760 RepID=A0A438I2S6_VITVI|nr:hypothetical protein CK203_039982 [Vitis vinifera]
MTFASVEEHKPNVEVKEIKAPAESEKKGEQESTLVEADPQRNVAQPNVAQEEIPVVEVTEIKMWGMEHQGPNAVKKEIKVMEVTQRTFSGTAQWVRDNAVPSVIPLYSPLGEAFLHSCLMVNQEDPASIHEISICRVMTPPSLAWERDKANQQTALCYLNFYKVPHVQVKQTEINLGETKSNTTCAAEIKERAAEIEACLHKKVQKEWACALKAKKQATKISGSPPVSMAKKFDQSTKEEQPKCTSNNLKSKNNGISAASTVKKPDKTKDDEQQKCASSNGPNQKNSKKWACALCQWFPSASMAKKSDQSTKEEQLKCTSTSKFQNNGISAASKVKKPDDTKDDERQKCASSNGRNQKNNKKQEKALVPETNEQGHQKNLKQTGDGMKELGSWCNICNVSCTSELDMASHLNGRRHFDSIKQLSELWCGNCNVKCNSEVDMASHQNGRRHLEQLKERLGLWCSICSVSCNSKVDMDSHLNGRRHLDQIEEQLRFWCGACNLMCNSELKMASHLNRRSHLKTMRNI